MENSAIVDSIENEEARLNALRGLGLLDTEPSESFDRLTRLASRLLEAPVSTVSLTDHDRQWFKSRFGVELKEIPRAQAPCHYAIQGGGIFVVPDMLEDVRFKDSPLAQAGIRFYAGAPLVTRDGYGLGTLCVVDATPRRLDAEQEKVLTDLAGLVMAQVELQSSVGRVDPISLLPNQNQLFEDLAEAARAHPGESRTALLVDLVSSERFNQGLRVFGAAFFEEVIRSATRAMRGSIGARRLYQLGSTRCLLLLKGDEDWEATVRTLVAALREPFESRGIAISLDPAVGVLPLQLGMLTPRDILQMAVSAADDARRSELTVSLHDREQDLIHKRSFTLLAGVHKALQSSDQFRLVYQPRIDISSGQCVGAEALIRWNHPDLGNVPPAEFIPLVEQTALVRPITEWVMEEALRQIGEWQQESVGLRVSINASVINLQEDDFSRRLERAMSRHGVDPAGFELEFTESAMARDGARMRTQLAAVRAMGVEVAIDDFGTGYSNLAYLHDMPASVLKVDRSFMGLVVSGRRDQRLIRGMISMAQDLGYRVVAEGVETQEILDVLTSWSCNEAQGYLISRPLEVPAFREWLTAGFTQIAGATGRGLGWHDLQPTRSLVSAGLQRDWPTIDIAERLVAVAGPVSGYPLKIQASQRQTTRAESDHSGSYPAAVK